MNDRRQAQPLDSDPIGAVAPARSPHPPRRSAKMGLMSVVAVMYLVVSGGAYGMEDAVRIAGPRLLLLLCLIAPLTVSLPTALMAAELTALIPHEGGFYLWVKQAFGPFAAFAEAWFTMLYTAVDMALYPVLFAAYLSFLIPLSPWGGVLLGIALVWAAGILNLLGVRPVGDASILLMLIVLAPFTALVVAGLPRLIHWQPPAAHWPPGGDFFTALGSGLTIVIWNFCGFENLSVVAGEIETPARNYLRAIWIVLPLVTLGYLLPLLVSLSGASGVADWTTGHFSEIGRRLGGAWLGIALALGGAGSAFALFEAGMLWVSRVPFVLAREGYLPPALAELSRRSAAPASSIVACCLVFTLLVPLGFLFLVVMDVFFYMAALVLEMGALVRLRALAPDRAGAFTIGGGPAALYAVATAPILTWLLTFGLVAGRGSTRADLLVCSALALAAWPTYLLCRRRWGGPRA